MAMSKRDYVAIAKAINDVRWAPEFEAAGPAHGEVENAFDAIANNIANHCAADNPRFDRQRFLEACGVNKT